MSAKLPLSMFAEWLARGERGMSSEAIVAAVTGERIGQFSRGWDHPWDPGDLRWCVQLLDAHPVTELVFKEVMRGKSPEWAALVDVWDEIVALLREEMAENTGRAPRTYARMQEVLNGVRYPMRT